MLTQRGKLCIGGHSAEYHAKETRIRISSFSKQELKVTVKQKWTTLIFFTFFVHVPTFNNPISSRWDRSCISSSFQKPFYSDICHDMEKKTTLNIVKMTQNTIITTLFLIVN